MLWLFQLAITNYKLAIKQLDFDNWHDLIMLF